MPIVKNKANSSDPRTRQGASLVICEIMLVKCSIVPRLYAYTLFRNSASEGQREDYEDDIIAIVRAALVDDEADVRSAAAQAFDVLQEQVGVKAIDQTIPTLLEALRQPGKGSGTALQALQEVMSVSVT